MARSGIPRRSQAPRFADEGRERNHAANGNETKRRAQMPNSRGDHARASSGPQPNGLRRNEADSAGLHPEDILVYVERGEGRGDGPSAKGREERQIGRTLTGTHGERQKWKLQSNLTCFRLC